ncbi:putative ABC transporter ATP-binding protein YxlF [Planctomycetes bacterium CA13]|uniref:Putative ABC transporter ATP-binding protein YxlF n=1 Tax=Novipirellula herctigrandis TaxID=2527986 RepID=A0A5C5Z8P3_9BACT|nr:putative ABC transporter ATP-binding protein YxlF [Planctomycetes bacterium CA13]
MDQPNFAAIHAVGLTRYFESKCVVNNLDFRVPSGKVTALLGLNGAGKTTTLRMMMGLLAPTRGTCQTLGVDSQSMSPEHLSRIGYLVEGHYLYPWMKVTEVARFARDGQTVFDDRRFDEIVHHFGIMTSQRCGDLSRGQRAGVSLAATLAADPELLVLDDPALGLDPVSRRSLNETLVDFAAQTTTDDRPRTVLLSTHLIDDVERIADEIAVMIAGRLLIHASVAEFQNRVTRYAFDVPAESENESLVSQMQAAIDGLVESRMVGKHCTVCVADAADDVAEQLAKLSSGSVETLAASLDELVVAYLSRDRAEHSFLAKRNGHKVEEMSSSSVVTNGEQAR